MRKTLMQLIRRLGVASMLHGYRKSKRQVPILVFHRIDPEYDPYTQPLAPDLFGEFLTELKKSYTIYPVSKLHTINDPKACFISFDDATNDFFDFAMPILKELNVPATLFVPVKSIDDQQRTWNNELIHFFLHAQNKGVQTTIEGIRVEFDDNIDLGQILGLIDKLNQHPQKIWTFLDGLKSQLQPVESDFAMPMTWDQLRNVSKANIEIGNHSLDHYSYAGLTQEQIQHDLQRSNQRMIEEGLNPISFAYPMGMVDPFKAVTDIYNLDFSTQPKLYSYGSKVSPIPRLSIYDRSVDEMILRTAGFHSIFNR